MIGDELALPVERVVHNAGLVIVDGKRRGEVIGRIRGRKLIEAVQVRLHGEGTARPGHILAKAQVDGGDGRGAAHVFHLTVRLEHFHGFSERGAVVVDTEHQLRHLSCLKIPVGIERVQSAALRAVIAGGIALGKAHHILQYRLCCAWQKVMPPSRQVITNLILSMA